jgi:type IV pilus assembly protein PilV
MKAKLLMPSTFHPSALTTHCCARSLAARQRGATLIEILVSVLILSFGLLGMAALQTRALQGNQSSLNRSQAVMLNNSMLDAMRIDRANAQGGNYNMSNVCGPAGIGSGTTLADNNRRDWLTAARDNMGGSDDSPICGTITCGVNFVCTVTLTWDDSKSGGLSDQSLTVEGRL